MWNNASLCKRDVGWKKDSKEKVANNDRQPSRCTLVDGVDWQWDGAMV